MEQPVKPVKPIVQEAISFEFEDEINEMAELEEEMEAEMHAMMFKRPDPPSKVLYLCL